MHLSTHLYALDMQLLITLLWAMSCCLVGCSVLHEDNLSTALHAALAMSKLMAKAFTRVSVSNKS